MLLDQQSCSQSRCTERRHVDGNQVGRPRAQRDSMLGDVVYGPPRQHMVCPPQLALEPGKTKFDGGNQLLELAVLRETIVLVLHKQIVPLATVAWVERVVSEPHDEWLSCALVARDRGLCHSDQLMRVHPPRAAKHLGRGRHRLRAASRSQPRMHRRDLTADKVRRPPPQDVNDGNGRRPASHRR